MKVAIVTGSGGLIGSEAVRFFADKFDIIVGIDNDSRAYFFGKEASVEDSIVKLEEVENYRHYFIDIRNYDALRTRIFNEFKDSISLVIHTAAQPSHDWAAKEPLTDFGINAMGTMNLLELTRLYCPKASFIFTSTNKVYGDRPNYSYYMSEGEVPAGALADELYKDSLVIVERPTRYQGISRITGERMAIDETMSLDRTKHSVFGASKVAADVMVQEYGRYFGMNTVVFRGGCLTGPSHQGAELHGFLSYLVKCMVQGKDYTVFGYKGKQVRDNIHSFDLINMFWHYYNSPIPGEVYNAGGGMENSISILEAIDFVNKILEKNDRSKWDKYSISEEARIGDHVYYVTDFSKFQRDFPEWPGITVDLSSLLEQMVMQEIYKANE